MWWGETKGGGGGGGGLEVMECGVTCRVEWSWWTRPVL